MSTITKKELIDRIAERTQAKRVTVKSVIQAFLDEITRELGENNRLEFRDFRVDVPAKRTVKFKMGRLMRQKLCTSATLESTEAK